MTTCPNCGLEIDVSSGDNKTADVERQRKGRQLNWIIGISLASLVMAIAILLVAIFDRQKTFPAYNPNILNLKFECFDYDSGKNIADCSIHLRIIEESQIQEFDVFSTEEIINIPVRTRLSITATSPGYSNYSEIFEYIDLGDVQVHIIKLQELVP